VTWLNLHVTGIFVVHIFFGNKNRGSSEREKKRHEFIHCSRSWPSNGQAVDSRFVGRGFDSRSFRFRVTTFDELFTHVCLCASQRAVTLCDWDGNRGPSRESAYWRPPPSVHVCTLPRNRWLVVAPTVVRDHGTAFAQSCAKAFDQTVRFFWYGNVTSAGWQVTLCYPIWHGSFRSGEACC